MPKALYQPLPLIDANQLSDEELKKQRWIGPMLAAIKHIRKKDMTEYALKILASTLWNPDNPEERPLLKLLLNYLFRRGNIKLTQKAITAKTQQLPHAIRRDVMTLAEQLQKEGMLIGQKEGLQKGKLQGKREGKQESMTEVALKLLVEGSEIAFVQKITGLSITEIEALKNQ